MTGRLSQYEEVFQHAYTHGLEEIYTLQTVDLSSIRRISATPRPKEIKSHGIVSDWQSSLDLGVPFRDWITPLWLKEPIRVLGLSANAQRGLITLRKLSLGDLAGLDFHQLVFGKVLGQGHLDEIQQKLASYISGQEKERTRQLDIASWIRGICSGLETKCAYLLCEKFGLHHCLSLTIGELGELKRANKETRLRWIEEATQQLCQKPPLETWKQIGQAFLLPWMRQRQGIATHSQLTERLQQLSLQPELVDGLLKMLSELLQCSCPYSIVLRTAEENVFCDHDVTLKQYCAVLTLVSSYFYKACPQYGHDHLVCLIAREKAKHWEDISDEFIERCLRLSSHLLVRKLPKLGLVVMSHRL